MKKNTVRLYVLALVLGGSVSAFAQGRPAKADIKDTNVKGLIELSREFENKYEKDYAEAVKLAAINNWPLVIKGENEKVSVLTKVSAEGIPLYTTTSNAGSAITSRANHLQPGGSLGLNLTGEFANGDVMYAGVWDGGYPLSNHLDLQGRVLPYDGGNSAVSSYHPTHVTATIIGAGINTPLAKGLAPKAIVLSSNFQSDFPEMTDFAAEGYILSNHSYGLDQAQIPPSQLQAMLGSYDEYSQSVDKITFAAPYYLPVVAAGNDGDQTYDRLTDRSVSKNAIAVAAVTQVNQYTGPGSVTYANFSSWGPTNDFRIKPDISSKGVQVYSASNANVSAHAYDQGTSMAAPGVTGAILLLQQYYSNLHPNAGANRNFMRSSTVRGLVAHTADEAGDADGPDPIYGWGLLNAKKAAELLAADVAGTSAKIEELVLLPGQTYTKQVVASGAESLIATLAWTDPAGTVTMNSTKSVLVNNLDITVTKDGVTYYPWKLDGSGQLAEKGVNNADNIEKVEINNAAGVYTITISHKNATLVNPNGSPQQAYSLLVSGITGVPAGLEDVNKTSMFSLWPNPAQDELNISLIAGVEKDATAAIYDVQGRLVLSAALTAVDNVINVQGLVKGIYMVTIKNGDKSEVKKVIIK